MARFIARVLAFAAASAFTSVAGATPQAAALGWTRASGAEQCIAARDLAVAVEKRLGRAALASASHAERFIDGRVEPVASGFRVSVTVSDAKGAVLGTRELEDADPSCRALDEPIVLVVALLVDPEAAGSTSAAPSPDVVERARPAALVAQAPLPPPPAAQPWRASLELGPAFMVGLLPKVGAAASLRGEIVPPSFIPIEIGGAVWLGVDASAPTIPTAITTVTLSYATLGLCPLVYRTATTAVRGCADVAVGALRATGRGFTATNTSADAPFVEGMLAGRVTRRIVGPLELGVGVGLAVPFTRPSFDYLGAARTQQELLRVGPVAGVLDAAVGLSFP